MILDFKHNHSGHCESGATSNLIRHYGLEISEPMAFGIGGGLFFCYLPFIKAQEAPMFAFRTLAGKIFRHTTERIGADTVMIKKFKDPAKAMAELDRNLENGIPTGVQVGTFHLKYFPPEYRLHFNFHNVVVFGRENGVYHIGEPVRERTQLLLREDLQKARFARGMFGPNGKMYYIRSVPKQPDMHKAISQGIQETVKNMLKNPVPYIGIKGMRKLARDIKGWPSKLPEEKARFYLIQFVRSAEEFGTGGAAFRYMYGAFLKEASEMVRNEIISEASRQMGETATLWRNLSYRSSRFIKNREESRDDYSVISDILLECASGEERIFRGLARLKI